LTLYLVGYITLPLLEAVFVLLPNSALSLVCPHGHGHFSGFCGRDRFRTVLHAQSRRFHGIYSHPLTASMSSGPTGRSPPDARIRFIVPPRRRLRCALHRLVAFAASMLGPGTSSLPYRPPDPLLTPPRISRAPSCGRGPSPESDAWNWPSRSACSPLPQGEMADRSRMEKSTSRSDAHSEPESVPLLNVATCFSQGGTATKALDWSVKGSHELISIRDGPPRHAGDRRPCFGCGQTSHYRSQSRRASSTAGHAHSPSHG
jgi:hypothetical protein